MARIGWTVEQRATVRRHSLFATVFTVLGVALSVFLIGSGNSGGWVVLGMVVCIAGAGYLFVGSIRRDQP
ncbi:hypothetical protein [Streptomyces albus]|uniref:hypothetical protein n=1 Tax=Streptomyces albus TaxID=1888 RepID=UPI0004CB2C06|nr:hypothetical protein [Streptomyces albus]